MVKVMTANEAAGLVRDGAVLRSIRRPACVVPMRF